MLKYIYVVIALSAITLNSFAQKVGREKVSGIVKTTDGIPAEFISVSLLGTVYGGLTDKDGYFEFEAPVGTYTLVVYSISAHKKEYPITIQEDTINYFPELTVIENKNQLDEVVITGQFRPQSLSNSIYKIKVIDNAQIQQKAATNVQSLLNTEIGIRLSNDMAMGETDFELMGMSGNNVKVLIDGIPMIDRLDKKQSLSQIDINTIERVEIVEGPMSVVYGSDALAGVINIITKNGKLNDKKIALGAKIQDESIGDEYNLFHKDGYHIQNVHGQYSHESGFYGSASFTHNDYGGWQGDSVGRRKQWQPKEQYILGGKIGFSKRNYSFNYRLDYLNEDLLTMADINPNTKLTSDKHFIVNRFTHQLQGFWNINNRFSLTAAGSYQDYKRRTKTINIDTNTGKETLSLESGAQDETEYSAWFGRIVGVWKILPNLTLQPGLEVQSDNGKGDRLAGSHDITNTAIFLSAEYMPLHWLSIRPGVRTSFNSVYDPPLAIPSANVKVKLSGNVDMRLSYARGFRAPTLMELYHSMHDSNHNIDGNPDLEAEYSNSYMASLTWRSFHGQDLRLTTTLNGFYNDFRDRISMMESVDKAGFYTYYNVDRYKTNGLSLENNLYWKNLSASLNFSYIGRYNRFYKDQSYIDQDMDEFRYSPEISAGLNYNWAKVADFSLFYKFTGKRKEYYVDSSKKMVLQGMNSFNWADFTVSRQMLKSLNIQVGIKNIFDITTVRNSASGGGAHSTSTGVSQIGCGRSYFVGIAYNFQK